MSWGETLFLKKIIEGKKSLVASDNPFYTLLASSVSTKEKTYQSVASFIAKVSGSVRIVVNARAATSGSTIGVDIGVYEEETLLVDDSVFGNDATNVTMDIKIDKGKLYSIKFKSRGSYTVYVNSVHINANIVDGSLIKEA